MKTSLHQDALDYLEAKQKVWKPRTVKATASRLVQYSPCQDAEKVWSEMKKQGLSPYYIKVCFISLATCTDWLMAQGRATFNNYRTFMEGNTQLFRNAYEDNYATITWEEYQAELQAADPELKRVLILLGYGGLRADEIYSFDGSRVLGKGGKYRPVHLPADAASDISNHPVSLSYFQIYRRLKHNPHAYRKLAADRWLRAGLDLKTVQVLLGHTNLASTQRYLRPLEKDELKARLEQVWDAS